MLVPFAGKRKWDAETVARPWGGKRPSIHDHLLKHFEPLIQRVTYEGMVLPDAPPREPGQVLGFVPGAEQWIATNHLMPGEASAEYFFRSIRSVLRGGDPGAFDTFYDDLVRSGQIYDLLREDYGEWETKGVQPPVFLRLLRKSDLDWADIASFARLLATEAPDSSAVSLGLGIMAAFPCDDAADIAHALGRYDGFTTEAITVLSAAAPDPEAAIWALARDVHGWGRVHCVQELHRTEREDIAEWMLLEGHLTESMPDSVTQICAEVGRLVERLRAPTVDPRVFEAAGRIIVESLNNGEYYNLDAWHDGQDIAEHYVRHADAMACTVSQFNDLLAFRSILLKGTGWRTIHVGMDEDVVAEQNLLKRPWNESIRAPMIAGIDAVAARADWPGKILVHLEIAAPYGASFSDGLHDTLETAALLEVDAWDVIALRIERGEDLWFFLFMADHGARFDRIVEMADRLLPIAEMAALPRDAEMNDDLRNLFYGLLGVMSGLQNAPPGTGWHLVELGLGGPSDMCRQRAIFVLDEWGADAWPLGARLVMERAAKSETIPRLRDMMRRLLDGRPLLDPHAFDPYPFEPETD